MNALDKGPLGGEAQGSELSNGAAGTPRSQDVDSADPSIARLSGGPTVSGLQRRDAGSIRRVDSELNLIALEIEDLRGRLEKANARLGNAEYLEASELEIGQLLVEAQRSSDAVLTHLDAKVHEVLVALETKARKILAEATQEAHQIRRQAQQSVIAATRTASEIRASVAGLTSVNDELLKELGELNTVLDPATQADATQAVNSSNSSSRGFEDLGAHHAR
jgi:cell division septum initiation protein DivIVA